jgi:hypothetical protein
MVMDVHAIKLILSAGPSEKERSLPYTWWQKQIGVPKHCVWWTGYQIIFLFNSNTIYELLTNWSRKVTDSSLDEVDFLITLYPLKLALASLTGGDRSIGIVR